MNSPATGDLADHPPSVAEPGDVHPSRLLLIIESFDADARPHTLILVDVPE